MLVMTTTGVYDTENVHGHIPESVSFSTDICPVLDNILSRTNMRSIGQRIDYIHNIMDISNDTLYMDRPAWQDRVLNDIGNVPYHEVIDRILTYTFKKLSYSCAGLFTISLEGGHASISECTPREILVSFMVLDIILDWSPSIERLSNYSEARWESHVSLERYIGLSEIDAKEDARFINSECRIYRCKDCGRLTYTEKKDDEFMLQHGLKPRKRCTECIRSNKMKGGSQ